MAGKGGYPVGNPPPYSAPGAAVYNLPPSHNVVVVSQAPNVVTKSSGGFFSSLERNFTDLGNKLNSEMGSLERTINMSFNSSCSTPSVMRGLFGQIGHELNVLGKTFSREVDWTADQINKSLATTAQGNVLNLFQSGNVVQLVSRSSGRCLEIVQGPTSLVVDGLGPDGAPYATWTVVNEGGNQVRLHNQHNFLAIINGNTIIISMPPGTIHGVETKFQLTQRGQFIHLESMKERGRHIGILPTGQLKAALATGKEDHSMFGVRLVYSPYSVTTSVSSTSVKH